MTNPKIGTLCDHFDQGSINSNLWTNLPGASLATLTAATVPTTLTPSPSYGGISFPWSVTIPAFECIGSTGSNSGLQSVNQYDLTGSGLSMEFISFTPYDAVTAYPLVMSSGSDYVAWVIDNSGNLDVSDSVNGITRVQNAPIPASTYRFWRIRESGGTTYWDYSADGVTWTNAVNVSNPFSPTSVTVGLSVTTASSGAGQATLVCANVNYVL